MEKAKREGGWGEMWDGGRAFREGSSVSKTASRMGNERKRLSICVRRDR